ncbi:11749_t:CDS:2, partial [Dentiscutata heterogama]
MAETFSEDLVEDFKNLYETKERYDTIITVGKEPNVEPIHAHSVILCTRSPYFRRALSDEWAEKKDGYFILSKPNISALIFKIILKFLYCGIVDLNSQEVEIILELLVAADELLIQKLVNFVQEFLTENGCKFLQQNPIKMVHFVTHNEQFNELKEAYLEIVCKKPKLLFDSEEFLSLEEGALKLILKCDNLDMKECDIWKKLVEWGHPTEMDHKELMPEVWKYKHLLSEHLIEDILTCFLDSNVKPLYNTFLIRWGNFKIDSVLINKEIALLLMKWIDKKTIDDKTSKGFQYNFNLLFRSSLDGLSSKTFHRKFSASTATFIIQQPCKPYRRVLGLFIINLSVLKLALEEKVYARGSIPDSVWVSNLDKFLKFIVGRRIKRVNEWIEKNLARFSKENNEVIITNFAFEREINRLSLFWDICRLKCYKCGLSCLKTSRHDDNPDDAIHDCLTDHECHHECEFKENHPDGIIPICEHFAAHDGKHECSFLHLCGAPCIYAEKKNCQRGLCAKENGHENTKGNEAHKCNSTIHYCGEPCSLNAITDKGKYECKNECMIPCEIEHDVHKCQKDVCPIECPIKNCQRQCDNKNHFHAFEENAIHFCGEEHDCQEKCEEDGICKIVTEPTSIEAEYVN